MNRWAPWILIVAMVAITALLITAMVTGLRVESTPLLVTALSSIGAIVAGVLAATNAREASTNAKVASETTRDTHSLTQRTYRTGELTASKLAALQQVVESEPRVHACHDPTCEIEKEK